MPKGYYIVMLNLVLSKAKEQRSISVPCFVWREIPRFTRNDKEGNRNDKEGDWNGTKRSLDACLCRNDKTK